jgi:nucleotide-binding universal stress UspA family protein
MLPIQTILHPTDFSRQSAYALELACSLARDHGAQLIVLHVFQPPLTAFGGPTPVPPQPEEDSWEEVRDQLSRVPAGDPQFPVQHRLEQGDAVQEILRVAQESACDLIVMGTHGRTGLGRLLLGSVAEQLVRKALCPVLTVKSPVVGAVFAARAHTEEVVQV